MTLRVPQPRPALRHIQRTPWAEYAVSPRWRLDKNENLIPPRVLAREVLGRLSPEVLNRYPDYSRFLRQLSRWGGCRPHELLLSAGSDGAIKLVFETYIRPGDEFVVPSPSFAMFEIYGRVFGGRLVSVPFPADLSAPVEGVLKAIGPRTRVVALASPNNPTGTTWENDALRAVARRAGRFGALVLVDEAYYYFTRRTFWPEVRRFPNVVLTRTFSKAAGLAGARLGFAFARASLIENLRKCQCMFEVNGLSLALAERLLKKEKILWDYAAQVEEGRRVLASSMGNAGFRVLPGQGNFLIVDSGRDPARAVRRLIARGVRVGHGYRHPTLRHCLKITLGPPAVMRSFYRLFSRAEGGS